MEITYNWDNIVGITLGIRFFDEEVGISGVVIKFYLNGVKNDDNLNGMVKLDLWNSRDPTEVMMMLFWTNQWRTRAYTINNRIGYNSDTSILVINVVKILMGWIRYKCP